MSTKGGFLSGRLRVKCHLSKQLVSLVLFIPSLLLKLAISSVLPWGSSTNEVGSDWKHKPIFFELATCIYVKLWFDWRKNTKIKKFLPGGIWWDLKLNYCLFGRNLNMDFLAKKNKFFWWWVKANGGTRGTLMHEEVLARMEPRMGPSEEILLGQEEVGCIGNKKPHS